MPKPKDILPSDDQLEREILGSLFGEDPGPLLNARAVIAEDDFSLMEHRRVFQSVCRLADAGKPRTKTEVFADLQATGTPVTLSMLIDLDDFAWAIDRMLVRLRDLSRRRKLIFRGQQLMASAADLNVSIRLRRLGFLLQPANSVFERTSTQRTRPARSMMRCSRSKAPSYAGSWARFTAAPIRDASSGWMCERIFGSVTGSSGSQP